MNGQKKETKKKFEFKKENFNFNQDLNLDCLMAANVK
jgi:hypothetical protein